MVAKKTDEKAAEQAAAANEKTWVELSRNPVWHFWGFKTKAGETVVSNGTTFIGLLEKKHSYPDTKNIGKTKWYYNLKDAEGKSWTVFGTTVLDRRMETISEQTEVKIEYKGKEDNARGGKTHVFTVLIPAPVE